MPKALIILAEGFEEIEAVTPIDVLRRGGVTVVIAGLSGDMVTGSRRVKIVTDLPLDQVPETFDVLILPGGMPGTKNLAGSPKVKDLVKRQMASGRIVAAICAAPGHVLGEACSVLNGKKACGFPGTEDKLKAAGAIVLMDPVVRDGNLITARAAGNALAFSLKILEALQGAPEAEKVAKAMLATGN